MALIDFLILECLERLGCYLGDAFFVDGDDRGRSDLGDEGVGVNGADDSGHDGCHAHGDRITIMGDEEDERDDDGDADGGAHDNLLMSDMVKR